MAFAHAVAVAVARVPLSHVQAFARAVQHAPHVGTGADVAALAAVPSPGYRESATGLLAAWRLEPAISGASLGLAALSAVSARDLERGTSTIDVVVTGPSTPHVSVRATRAVLLEIVEQATSQLMFLSYVAYKVDALSTALHTAIARGVRVRMILEGGDVARERRAAAQAFASLRDTVEFYEWPSDRRPAGASLHAKGVVADGRVAFVSSANLTGHALDHNLELGLLVRGGPVPIRIVEHFGALIAAGVLRRV
jgi:phosphatidylserine/phosphatidylglycerophosphate/cardiolipin synthase-like enzyme